MATAINALDTKIIGYLSALNLEEKKAVLSVVRTFAKESKQTDFWEELSKEQQVAIDKAMKEADEGKVTAHKTVMKKLRR